MIRSGSGRRLLAVVLAGSLLGGALAGCGVLPRDQKQAEETTTVDYGSVSDAVTQAVPRVVAVREPARSQNGFGHRLSLGLETESAEPFTAEELDAVVEAIWTALPWEPNTIKVTAGAETDQGREVVDLRAAAAELDSLSATNAGQGGVSLTGMATRYGPWKAPE